MKAFICIFFNVCEMFNKSYKLVISTTLVVLALGPIQNYIIMLYYEHFRH